MEMGMTVIPQYYHSNEDTSGLKYRSNCGDGMDSAVIPQEWG